MHEISLLPLNCPECEELVGKAEYLCWQDWGYCSLLQYLNILNKPGIQEFGFGTKIDVVYTFDDLYKNFSVDLFASIKTYGQTEIRYTLDYDARKPF